MKLFVLESAAVPYWVQLESSHHVVIFLQTNKNLATNAAIYSEITVH